MKVWDVLLGALGRSGLRQNGAGAGAGRGPAVLASLCLCFLFLIGLGPAATAQAALIHSFDSYMGGGSLSTPEALAVDQSTGDLYVLEHGSGCVSRFYGERGGPEALEPHKFPATGTNKICGLELREGPSAAQVAIDNSGTSTEGEIYVNSPLRNGGLGATLGYDPEGNLETELAPRGEDYICGVTTFPSGNVVVAQHYAGIWDYNRNDPVTDADFTGGEYEGPICGIARDSTGLKYNVFEPNGPVIKARAGEFAFVLRDAAYAVTVAQATDDVYVSEGSDVAGISAEGVEFEQFGSGQLSESRGVAIDQATGTAYVSDTPNGRVAIYSGVSARRVTVDFSGTGLGAVSADTAPIDRCGDEGPCVGYYPASTIVLQATPQPHSEIDGWTGCNIVNPAGDKCTVDVAGQDRDVVANFRRLQQPVSAGTAGTGTGSISVAHELGAIQECGAGGTCTGPYDEGSQIELLATPTGHSTFTGWSGDCTNQTGPCELAVEGNPSVTANFTAEHQISVKKGGSGAGSVVSEPSGLTCGGVCVGFFTDGVPVTLTAISSGHSTFAGWTGSGCSGTGTCEIVAGESTKTVTALFTHDLPGAVTDPGATFVGQHVATVHGSVNPNGAEVTGCVVEYGTSVSYGAAAPCAPSAVGNGASFIPIGVNLSGLLPGTTYHYRLSVINVGGTAYGGDQTLRTLDDTCDTREALCPASVPVKETRACGKGRVLKQGRCVKKRRHHKRSHRRHAGGPPR